VWATLRDGDFARFALTHPQGFDVRVVRPNGAELRLFATPEMRGDTPIYFVAEGGGRYAITARNADDGAAEYGLKFTERSALDDRIRPPLPQDELRSPRIEALRARVQSGDTTTTRFWSELEAEGTPIVEPLDARYDLVTFVWRTQYETRNVFLLATFGMNEGVNDALRLVPGTDVWYLTVKLPRGARFLYQLEPNRPTLPSATRVSAQLDPLHRGQRWNCPSGASKYRCRSVAQLPGASAEPWLGVRPSIAHGRFEKKTIRSRLQGVTRDLTVYLPAAYARDVKPLPLLVLFDGDDYLNQDWRGPEMWDNLIADRAIAPMVVVMVDNLPGRRLFDLVANETFGRFMATELVPWVRGEYNVSRDARFTVVGGASAGGFASTYLGLAHPEVFGNVLSISGAFWWSPAHNGGICGGVCADSAGQPSVVNRDATTEPNWLAQLALERPASKTLFYLSAGTFEADIVGTGAGLLEENRHLRDILRAKGGKVVFHQVVGGHETMSWRVAMADGLQTLLPPR
jgi:enterochelin esterase family protein